MKKLLVLFVVLLLVSSVSALAESKIDLSTMNLEELVALRSAVEGEINNRVTMTNNAIFGGTYFVGKDIKPGKYVFVVESAPSGNTELYFYENAEARENREYKWSGYLNVGDTYYVDLKEGMIVIIDGGSGRISEITPSWAP